MRLGFSIRIATGRLLFSPRASLAASNSFFRLKMGFLLAALTCQALLYARVTAATTGTGGRATRVIGLLRAALCFGIIGAGCTYILIE